MKKAIKQIKANVDLAEEYIERNDPETREDFYALVEGIRMKASEILEHKDK